MADGRRGPRRRKLSSDDEDLVQELIRSNQVAPDDPLLQSVDFLDGIREGRKAAKEHPLSDAQLRAFVRRLDS